jgi:hypothetical protein
MRLTLNLRGQFVILILNAVQDRVITFLLLRLHALAEMFLALRIENNAFNLGPAKVYADAKHGFTSSEMPANNSSAQRDARSINE